MFDASDRDTSLPRRIQTNTPLQALVTLNDPVYQEAAKALARRVMKEAVAKTSDASSADDILDARLAYETRLVLSRDPTPREMTVLRAFYKQALTMPKPPALMKVSMKLPEQSLGKEVPGRELDAFTAVGSVLFNLDAALGGNCYVRFQNPRKNDPTEAEFAGEMHPAREVRIAASANSPSISAQFHCGRGHNVFGHIGIAICPPGKRRGTWDRRKPATGFHPRSFQSTLSPVSPVYSSRQEGHLFAHGGCAEPIGTF